MQVANSVIEDEKKAVAPLLGKLYVSPTSTEDKIREAYKEITDAVDGQLLSDATSRNALYRIHVSLGKIVNNLDQAAAATNLGGSVSGGRRSVSRATSLGVDDRTVLAGASDNRTTVPQIKEEDEDEGDGVMEDVDVTDEDVDEVDDGSTIHMTTVQVDDDSLTDDLLDD